MPRGTRPLDGGALAAEAAPFFFEGIESHGPAAEFWQEHARFERRNAAPVSA